VIKKKEKGKGGALEEDGEDKGKKDVGTPPFSQTANTYQHRLVMYLVSDFKKGWHI
jgi:hypothetical protein